MAGVSTRSGHSHSTEPVSKVAFSALWLGPARPYFVKIESDGTWPFKSIASFWNDLPRSLFGPLEEEAGCLLPSHQRVAVILETVRIEEFVKEPVVWLGRPPYPRKPLARAFIAKAALNITTTADLIDRLRVDRRLRRVCGILGRVPSESTFSRAFDEFAQSGLLDAVHATAVKTHLGSEVVHHASHDSTAIPGRERCPKKPKEPDKPKPGRGGRRVTGQKPPPTVQELQEKRGWKESLTLLPSACDYGVKIGPKGYPIHWRGYKAHVSTADDGTPLAMFTTSASVSDCTCAIPLMQMVTERVGQVFYNLFDAGYQGKPIVRVSEKLGQVPIVAPKKTKKDEPPIPLTPDRFKRFASRTTVERFNSDLKENHGGNFIFVRGPRKVHTHLMFGTLCIFALRVLRI